MPKPSKYTVIWIDTAGEKPVLDYEVFTERENLEIRVVSFTSQGIQYGVVDENGDFVEVTIDTSPRITIGAAKAPLAAKARRQRSDKGKPRGKKAEEKPANGAVVTS